MNKIIDKDFVVTPDNHLDLVQIHLVSSYNYKRKVCSFHPSGNSTKIFSLVQCNAMDTAKLLAGSY